MIEHDQSILLETDPHGVATITLNRPQTHNAFDQEMVSHLNLMLKRLEQDPNVKVIILAANGKSFSAGADLQYMHEMAEASLERNVGDAKLLGELLYRLYSCQRPTIAMVQGSAFGGGVGLIACAHYAIVSTEAHFSFSEVKLGLIPAVISPYVINAIGIRHARALFLTANTFDAATAEKIGLCHEIVPPEMLTARTQQLVHMLLQNGPQALKAVNNLIRKLEPLAITPELIKDTANEIARIRQTPEGEEGIKAFLEKRKPRWIPK